MPTDGPAGGLGVGVAVFAALNVIELLVRTWRTPSEVRLDERKLLDADEREFRREILVELRRVRGELADCQKAHAEAATDRIRMSAELEMTNRELVETREELAATKTELAATRHRLDRVTAAALASGLVLDPEV